MDNEENKFQVRGVLNSLIYSGSVFNAHLPVGEGNPIQFGPYDTKFFQDNSLTGYLYRPEKERHELAENEPENLVNSLFVSLDDEMTPKEYRALYLTYLSGQPVDSTLASLGPVPYTAYDPFICYDLEKINDSDQIQIEELQKKFSNDIK